MSLLRLLAAKKSPLLRPTNITDKKNDLDFELNDDFTPFMIDSYEKNKFNDKEYYENVNIFIEETRTIPFVFNHLEAFNSYKRIQKSIDKEKKNDFLLDGI